MGDNEKMVVISTIHSDADGDHIFEDDGGR